MNRHESKTQTRRRFRSRNADWLAYTPRISALHGYQRLVPESGGLTASREKPSGQPHPAHNGTRWLSSESDGLPAKRCVVPACSVAEVGWRWVRESLAQICTTFTPNFQFAHYLHSASIAHDLHKKSYPSLPNITQEVLVNTGDACIVGGNE